MAYRAEQQRDLCAACGEIARARCVRCTSPLCGRHEPISTRRCDACESGYLVRETRVVRKLVVACVVFASAVGLIGAFGTHMARNGLLEGASAQAFPLVPSLAVFLFCAIFASPPIIKHVLRSRFLRERR